ncbi:MAG: LysM peptidoglycan-binding domain-containing protein [Mariprofundaceae bacterium]|nr:LysM peptidoglycan-binding domain-containing protein [Mariprofundaceae bacterium]
MRLRHHFFIISLLAALLISSCTSVIPATQIKVEKHPATSAIAPPIMSAKKTANKPLIGFVTQAVKQLTNAQRKTTSSVETLPEEEQARTRAKLRSLLLRFGEDSPNGAALNGLSKQVLAEMQSFQGKRRGFFQGSLLRGQKYLPMIQTIFADRKLPPEMAWIALIESGFRNNATSPKRATGMWQFMPLTARDFDLEVNRRLDERRDPYLATIAAREYLLDSIAIFGSESFMLATASYNCGVGCIQGALRQLKDPFTHRTFFHLRPALSKETQNYVPRFLAAVMIASEPSRYGFKLMDDHANAYVMIPKRSSLKYLAKSAGLSAQQIRELNHDLKKRSRTPVTHYMLRLPRVHALKLQSKLQTYAWQGGEIGSPRLLTLASKQVGKSSAEEIVMEVAAAPVFKIPPRPIVALSSRKTKQTSTKQSKSVVRFDGATPKGKYVRYRVRTGNTLADISRWFDTSIADIVGWNKSLSSSHSRLKQGQLILVYGLPHSQRKSIHKINRGEALSTIAARYDVSTDDLRGWNGIRGNAIRAGQKLVIYHHGGSATVAKKGHRKATSTVDFHYTVQHGNFLAGIAETFYVSVKNIKRWNRLRSSRIYAGQKLSLHLLQKPKAASYKVRRGDTLQKVVHRLKVSMLHLQTVNGITNASQIQAGKKLTYYR